MSKLWIFSAPGPARPRSWSAWKRSASHRYCLMMSSMFDCAGCT